MKSLLMSFLLVFSFSAQATQGLFESATRGDLKALKAASPRDLQKTDSEGETLLHKAAASGHSDVVQFLAKNKVDLNAKDKAGHTALFYAVSASHESVVKELLRLGAKVDSKEGSQEENVLFEAARVGNLNLALSFVKKDKSLLEQKNKAGLTPVFVAVENRQSKVALALLKNGANAKVGVLDLADFARKNHYRENSPLMKELKTRHEKK